MNQAGHVALAARSTPIPIAWYSGSSQAINLLSALGISVAYLVSLLGLLKLLPRLPRP